MTEGATDAPVSSDPGVPSMRARWRPFVRRLALGMAAGTFAALCIVFGWLYPYLSDDRSLDLIVRIVALDWRDFGEARAHTRLQYELDRAGIGDWVGDSDCSFLRDDAQRIVRCGWQTRLDVPGMDISVPLSFASEARLTDRGELR